MRRLLAAALTAAALVIPAAASSAADRIPLSGVKPSAPAGVARAKTTTGLKPGALNKVKAYKPDGNFTAAWTYADALKVSPDATTTTPRIPENFPTIAPSVWQWDTWPLTGLDTKPVTYKGWHVVMSLVADRSKVSFGDRHWVARIGYFYSRDGQKWTYGGQLMPENWGANCMEWAGTAIITDKNTVRQFYTSVGGERGPNCPTSPPYNTKQRLAVTEGKIMADEKGVWFEGFRKHKIIAEADGKVYQTYEQSAGYAFRDPFVFRNPEDNKVYALFEGNTGGVDGTYQCTDKDLGPLRPASISKKAITPKSVPIPPPTQSAADGVIGLMRAEDASLTKWKMLKPILSANCVNEQVERPHVVWKDGKTYLFTISHKFTYAPGLTGPDGVYGFVGTGLRSEYQPMNGSGLVLGNPPDAPEQNYSHEVMPNLLVQSFIDQVPRADGSKIPGGTLAPTLQLELDGSNSYLTRVLPYGYIPAMKAWQ